MTNSFDEYNAMMENIRRLVGTINLSPAINLSNQVGAVASNLSQQLKNMQPMYEEVFQNLRKSINQISQAMESYQSLIAQNAEVLRNVTIPHISLYREILQSLPYERLQESYDFESDIVANDEEIEEDVNIVHPIFFDAATKINFYINITENHINNSPSVTEEEKDFWNKTVKRILNFLVALFMAWALSDTPIVDWNITKSFEKVFELIDGYQNESVETTEVILNNDENSKSLFE